MEKDLFICTTPLQVLIAKSIILSPSYGGDRPDFLMLVLSSSGHYRYYYDYLAPLCSNSEFAHSIPVFPLYLPWLLRRFKKKRYRDVYLASVDSVHAQYALSFCDFSRIKTFDDGTANIDKNSIYYNDNPNLTERFKRILRSLTGNRYSASRIKEESEVHFTIYSGMSNISEALMPVDLISGLKVTAGRQERLNKNAIIFLGTVYEEALIEKQNMSKLIKKVHAFLDGFSSNDDIYYHPHPRGENGVFTAYKQDRSGKIAEEIILEKLLAYESVTLVGFASSVQFNFIGQKNVKNVVLCSDLIKDNFKSLAVLLESHGGVRVCVD